MAEFQDQLLGSRGRMRRSRLRPFTLMLAVLVAILSQVYLPMISPELSFFELPLLATVYFGLAWRSPVQGLLAGAAIGLIQDALSHNPLGLFGICKTLVGYFAASMSLRVDVDNSLVRFLLGALFFVFHQIFYWVLAGALLAQPLPLDPKVTAVSAVLNGLAAVPCFRILDRL